MNFAKRIAHSKTLRFLGPVLLIYLLLKRISGSAFAGILFAAGLYFSSPLIFCFQPYSLGELILWIEDRSEGQKIAIITTAITLLGFVLAFWQASLIWKDQKRTEIRLLACDEISEFFNKAWEAALVVAFHAESIAELKRDMQENPADVDSVMSNARHMLNKTQEFTESRKELSRLVVKVHVLKDRHFLVLSQHYMLMHAFDVAKSRLEDISRKMWFFAPLSADDPGHYLRMLAAEEGTDFVAVAQSIEESRTQGSAASGALRGGVLGNLFPPSVFSWFELRESMKKVREDSDG